MPGLTIRCPIVIAVTIDDSAIVPEAFFTVDGDSYVPGALTRGPWVPQWAARSSAACWAGVLNDPASIPAFSPPA